ncbi:Rad52/Rad22 family DNA repair protein [Streptomyces sp. NPDC088178]|uniref:Rad52/Rad22 family DNA repair protein n=1 Tax=Streptomyces sp. NPDC088178 TaxID=3365836 RepID=UPI0038303608
MAMAVEAPASNTAEGPTSHTQNQNARFSPYQLRMLHGGINKNRVQNLRGMSHLEAWDVRRELIRVFGFGGFTIETLSLDLVHQNGEMRRKKNKQGVEYGDPYMAWTVVYRAQVRLTLLDTAGQEIAHFEDGAAGDSVNQPSLGDAHDMAMKTSLSQALKRCAVNLGDQFGLSLYNDGSQDPVVVFSAAHPPQEWKPQAQPPEPEPVDPPVRPEPSAQQTSDESAPAPVPAATAAAAPNQQPSTSIGPKTGSHLDRLMGQVRDCWMNAVALEQIKADATKHKVINERVQDPFGNWMPFHQLLDNRIAELKQGGAERSAA